MNIKYFRNLLFFSFLSVLVSCSGEKENKLLGVWIGTDSNGIKQTFHFKEGGQADWIFESDMITGTFEIEYQVNYSYYPHHIDLYSFDSGPLEGKTLFGIFEFEGEKKIRLDVEPGDSEANGAEIRPVRFTDDTVVYEKVLLKDY